MGWLRHFVKIIFLIIYISCILFWKSFSAYQGHKKYMYVSWYFKKQILYYFCSLFAHFSKKLWLLDNRLSSLLTMRILRSSIDRYEFFVFYPDILSSTEVEQLNIRFNYTTSNRAILNKNEISWNPLIVFLQKKYLRYWGERLVCAVSNRKSNK